jgi:hypothetical protein
MIPSVPPRLVAARELLVIAIVEHALENLLLALAVEHPTMSEPEASGPPTLRRARAVARLAMRLNRELAAYRSSVDAAIGCDVPTDDPF